MVQEFNRRYDKTLCVPAICFSASFSDMPDMLDIVIRYVLLARAAPDI